LFLTLSSRPKKRSIQFVIINIFFLKKIALCLEQLKFIHPMFLISTKLIISFHKDVFYVHEFRMNLRLENEYQFLNQVEKNEYILNFLYYRQLVRKKVQLYQILKLHKTNLSF